MRKILDYSLYYFLGAGGIGMSALARYFNHYNKPCAGYDKTPTRLTNEMIKEGIDLHFDENTEYLEYLLAAYKKEDVLIIYTPAVPTQHSELIWLRDKGFLIKKRAEVLGEITRSFKTIAVAGTHGKTTTSTMVAHLLKTAGINCFAFLGGVSTNYKTNLLLGEKDSNKETYIVVEADEYDRSFHTLTPHAAIITSCDPDHLDIYKDEKQFHESFEQFAAQVEENGHLLVKNSVDNTLHLKNKRNMYSVISSTEISSCDFYGRNIRIEKSEFYFDLESKICSLKNLKLGIPGLHNVENAVAAAGICQLLGIDSGAIQSGLESFKGVKRRFDYIIKKENIVYIDDYAHHPTELNASITAAKQLFPDKEITVIFQPHLFSRTRDFANEFSAVLDKSDTCILLPIYPAREKPLEGITSEYLSSKMKNKNTRVMSTNEVINYLHNNSVEVLMTLGAGNIDELVEPIERTLNAKYN